MAIQSWGGGLQGYNVIIFNTIRTFLKMSQVGCGAQWLSGFSLGTRLLGGTAEAEETANGRSEIGIGYRIIV